MRGLSGSGVFFGENHDELSLVGIQVKAPSLQMLQCLDLREIIEEANKKLDVPILFQDEVVREEETINKSHIIPGDGYIEPRTVYIEELDIHVAVCPVTFEEYELFSRISCSYSNDEKDKYPVVKVTWDDAKKYCLWLGKKLKKEIRLLKSNEWNYIVEKNFFEKENLKKYITYSSTNLEEINFIEEDKFGLKNIVGNISEWCWDGKDNKKYIKGIIFDDSLNDINQLLKNDNMARKSTSIPYVGFRIIF